MKFILAAFIASAMSAITSPVAEVLDDGLDVSHATEHILEKRATEYFLHLKGNSRNVLLTTTIQLAIKNMLSHLNLHAGTKNLLRPCFTMKITIVLRLRPIRLTI